MGSDTGTYQKSFILDMDGVVYTGSKLIPGAKLFIDKLQQGNFKFMFLTNNSYCTPAELRQNLLKMGINVTEDHFYTSAMATASFFKHQNPEGCSAYIIGGKGVVTAFKTAGIKITDKKPDYVVIGETEAYDYKGNYTDSRYRWSMPFMTGLRGSLTSLRQSRRLLTVHPEITCFSTNEI